MTSSVQSPALITLILIASCNVLTTNMFLPSLPDMAAEFQVSAGLMSFAISGFLLMIAGMQLIIGPLSDLLGRRPVLLVSLSIYVFASALCVWAPSIELFFLGRCIQAVVVAGTALSQAIIRDTVRDEDAAASRLAFVVMVMAVIPMIAPIIGGLLGDLVGWRSNFLVMTVYGAVVLLVVIFGLPETNLNKTPTFIKQLQGYPTLIRHPRFWGFATTSALNLSLFYTFLILIPVVGQTVFDLSRSEVGILLGLMPLGYMIGNWITSQTVKRFGTGAILMTGRLLSVFGIVGILILHLLGVSTPLILFAPLVVAGAGNGFVMPATNAGAISVFPHLAGTAAGLNGALGMFFGAVLTTLSAYIIAAVPSVMALISIMLSLAVLGLLPALLLHVTSPSPAGVAPAKVLP